MSVLKLVPTKTKLAALFEEATVEDIVRSQAGLRLLNERIELLYQAQGETARTDWLMIRCECGRPECEATLRVMLGEYEAARLDGRLFLVGPGHGVDEVETPVVIGDRYDMVETLGDAALVAQSLLPSRSPR